MRGHGEPERHRRTDRPSERDVDGTDGPAPQNRQLKMPERRKESVAPFSPGPRSGPGEKAGGLRGLGLRFSILVGESVRRILR